MDLACFIFAQVEVLVLSRAGFVTFGSHFKIEIVIGQSVVYVPRGSRAKQTKWSNGRDGGVMGGHFMHVWVQVLPFPSIDVLAASSS